MPFITMSNLGANGRLGNQMFQYAALLGMGYRHGYTVVHPPQDTRLSQVFTISSPRITAFESNSVAKFTTIHEPKFSYSHSLINDHTGNVDLRGYFQTDKYWIELSDTIHSEFSFRDKSIDDTARSCIDDLKTSLPVVSIGVRRTDYLKFPNHHGLNLSYYDRAIETMHRKIGSATYIVVSDDPSWCRDFFATKYAEYGTFHIAADHFIHQTPDLVELSIMKHSDHNIGANSSFHWWGTWLNKTTNKTVIFPFVWFGHAGPQDYQDIYCDGWIKC